VLEAGPSVAPLLVLRRRRMGVFGV
jgi:hypothetical protein